METREKITAANVDEEEIDLLELFFMLLHNWRMILLALLIGAALMGGYHTLFVNQSYQATAEIYITNTDSVVSISDLQLSAALTDDYAQIIKSRTVLKRVISELDLDITYRELKELISVTNPDSTHIIDITVTCDDVELCRDIANALMNVGIKQIYQVIGAGEPNVIDYSEADAVENITPSLEKYMIIGGIAGAGLACALLVVHMLMNMALITDEDVDRYLSLPVLSAIPYYEEK